MFRLLIKRSQAVAHHVGGLLFLALFVVFIVQVAARFVFDQPLPWSDEAAVILYVWIILWACAVMVPAREHVVFDLIWNAASPRQRRWMAVIGHGLFAGLSLAAVPASWDYVRFMAREQTPVLGLSFQWVFFPFVLLLLMLGLRGLWALFGALSGRIHFQEDQS
jgi:TRAP-type C4-dicarboxylate transport system permease small subunit